jgi:hypothetical protein
MLDANDKSMVQYSKQLKIALGAFAGLATLITALAALFGG